MGKTRKIQTYTDSWARTSLIFVLPVLVLVIGLVIVPILMNFWLAFTNYKGFGVPFRYVGLQNFKSIFTDEYFWLVLLNTAKLLFIYVVVLNIFSIILASLIYNVSDRFGNVVKSLFYFPCLLAQVVIGFVWRMILNYQKGLANGILRSIGLDGLAMIWLGEPGLIIPVMSLVIVWFATGYYTVIYFAGLMNISPVYYEVSDVEGATGFQKFFHITLPLLAPSITINIVLSTMGVLGAYDLPNSLSSGGGPGYYGTTISMYIVRLVYEKRMQGRAVAAAVVMALIAVILAFIELKILLKREDKIND
jgi:ABC-type sugar transport system permease subunit